MDMPNPTYINQGEAVSLEEARAKLPQGIVAAGPDSEHDGTLYVFASKEEFERQGPELGLDPENPATFVPLSPCGPVYVYRGKCLNIEEAREQAPDGIVFAGPSSEAEARFYVLDSEDELPELAAELGLQPADLQRWMTLAVPSEVVFVYREKGVGDGEKELTLDELKELENPIVLAGPHTEIDGRFFVFDPDEPVRQQAERIGLDPYWMEKWSESRNA